jgi:hypothetical protein
MNVESNQIPRPGRSGNKLKISRRINRAILLALPVMMFSLFSGCPESVVEPLDTNFRLTADDVEANEIYLHVQATGNNAYGTVALTRDGRQLFEKEAGYHFSIDTVLHDQYLYPKRAYTYKAYYRYNGNPIDSSSPLRVTTLDTTSHSFTCDIYTIGDYSSSLNDVAIINDTCVWAVGHIYDGDSVYNAVCWNGRVWTKYMVSVRLQYSGSVLITNKDPIVSVFAPSSNDIWFVSRAGGVTRYKDNSWVMMIIAYGQGPGKTYKLWGSDSDKMYFAAEGGRLTFYNGVQWQVLESNTMLDIQDIFGAKNEKTGETEIMAVASNPYTSYERKILKISGTTVTTLPDSGIEYPLTGVWFVPGRKYYLTEYGIFTKHNVTVGAPWAKDFGSYYSDYYKRAVRGNAANDVAVACDGGDILHFDGMYWKSYFLGTQPYRNYRKIAMKGNTIAAVGIEGGYGLVAIGRRQ